MELATFGIPLLYGLGCLGLGFQVTVFVLLCGGWIFALELAFEFVCVVRDLWLGWWMFVVICCFAALACGLELPARLCLFLGLVYSFDVFDLIVLLACVLINVFASVFGGFVCFVCLFAQFALFFV